ncbi:hypothetical protein Scep_004228 [Stephania cephalantha]|uniref:Uncharacterized protein n=1 Tax=Stephania cephalantha TaxID=152367 RepID=A0AAP0KTN3_9MAGN
MPEEPASNSATSGPPSASALFIEVKCKSSGNIRRFSAATKAGFALQIINRKLDDGVVPGSYIEAVKEGEESVSFGPTSVLADYGDGWKLQTVDQDDPDIKVRKRTERGNNVLYMGRIFLALSIMALFGSILTWGLENLPSMAHTKTTEAPKESEQEKENTGKMGEQVGRRAQTVSYRKEKELRTSQTGCSLKEG